MSFGLIVVLLVLVNASHFGLIYLVWFAMLQPAEAGTLKVALNPTQFEIESRKKNKQRERKKNTEFV